MYFSFQMNEEYLVLSNIAISVVVIQVLPSFFLSLVSYLRMAGLSLSSCRLD